MNFKSLPQLLDFFKEEKTCIKYYEKIRWNGKPVCPHCNSDKPYVTTRGYKCSNKECHKKFTVKIGTIFENSKIPFRIWFAAIYLCTSHKKGISSLQLAIDLNITQKTAWFVLHRIREMLKDKQPQVLSNTVEIDETFIGGKEANKHINKKTKKTQGGANKIAVLGILERDGHVVTHVVPNTRKVSLLPIMVQTVEAGSTIYTDEKSSYRTLNRAYVHKYVVHKNKQYVKGEVHTNTIEGFWSQLKRGLDGIYHQVTPKHLQSYCNEFAFRYNNRTISDNDRFFYTLTKSANFILPYKQLISKK